jgi:hypothetical protein
MVPPPFNEFTQESKKLFALNPTKSLLADSTIVGYPAFAADMAV